MERIRITSDCLRYNRIYKSQNKFLASLRGKGSEGINVTVLDANVSNYNAQNYFLGFENYRTKFYGFLRLRNESTYLRLDIPHKVYKRITHSKREN